MDPTACIRDLIEALTAGDRNEARNCFNRYIDWKAAGGFDADFVKVLRNAIQED